MDYRYKFIDETNSRKQAMEALKKMRLDTTSETKEEKSGVKLFINKLWSYVNRKSHKSA
jgi:hypothetical protein